MSTLKLAYAGLGVEDVDAWAGFAEDVLGMQVASKRPDGSCCLRLDDRAHRIDLHPSAVNDVTHMGYEASDQSAVSDLAQALETADLSVSPLTADEARTRNVAGGIWLYDPGGLRVEIVHGLASAPTPFQSPRGAVFCTGAQGLGHFVISAPDIDRTLDFYERIGFRISDYIEMPLGPDTHVRLVFLHCNPRHHTLALLPLPTPRRMDHLMLEVSDVDTVLAAYYRAKKAGRLIVRHMGRHTNDRMLSFYVRTPAGFDVEYGCDGINIGENWEIATYQAISLWGHES